MPSASASACLFLFLCVLLVAPLSCAGLSSSSPKVVLMLGDTPSWHLSLSQWEKCQELIVQWESRITYEKSSDMALFYDKYAGFRIVFGDERADMIVSKAYGVEEFLLLTAPLTVFQNALHDVASQMNPEDNEAPAPNRDCDDWAGHPYIVGTDKVQSYEPQKWNDGGNVQMNDNCYNYGTNIITQTFAQPGCGTGKKWEENTCQSVTAAAIRDGLVSVTDASGQPSEGHYVGLCIWPGFNFHWYRKDDSGFWSHKPGATEARDVDNSGNKITDPAHADRGGYTDFCGYFQVIPSKIKIV